VIASNAFDLKERRLTTRTGVGRNGYGSFVGNCQDALVRLFVLHHVFEDGVGRDAGSQQVELLSPPPALEELPRGGLVDRHDVYSRHRKEFLESRARQYRTFDAARSFLGPRVVTSSS
jgi:hypothetical protein